MSETGHSSNFLAKVIGGLFAAVVAPTLTGVAVWFIEKRLDNAGPELTGRPNAQAGAVPGPPTPDAPPGSPPAAVAKKGAAEAAPAPRGGTVARTTTSSSTREPASNSSKKPADSSPAGATATGAAPVNGSRATAKTTPSSTSTSSSTVTTKAKAKAKAKEEVKDVPKLARASSSSSAATTTSPPAATTSSLSPATPKKKGQRARLFNGKDLTGFTPFLGNAPGEGGKSTVATPPAESVFYVSDGELHVTGKVFGGLASVREYEDYHLVVEYKWGVKRWPPRADLPRMSGIVLHATGPPGAVHGWSMAGITCVISENDAGALLIAEPLSKSIRFQAEADGMTFKKGATALVYKPGESLTTMQSGYLHHLGWRPAVALAKAAAGKAAAGKAAAGKAARELINPVGEWNRLECLCDGDKITVILNGTTVNVATKVSQTRGKLFVESQGAEISFRTINVRPLGGPGGPAGKGASPRR